MPSDLFECDCCELLIVTRKSPGIGYYCDRCLGHYGEMEDVGTSLSRFQTGRELDDYLRTEHEEMERNYPPLSALEALRDLYTDIGIDIWIAAYVKADDERRRRMVIGVTHDHE